MEEKDWEDESGERFIFRHRPATVYALGEIENDKLLFQSRKKLNDPGELQIDFCSSETLTEESLPALIEKVLNIHAGAMESDTEESWREGLERLKGVSEERADAVRAFRKHHEHQIEEIKLSVEENLKLGVCCFTKAGLSQTMIAHYGQNSGVILAYKRTELAPDEKCLREVTYSARPFLLNAIDIYSSADPDEAFRRQHQFMAHKAACWAYEKELRLILKKEGPAVHAVNAQALAGACLMPNADASFSRLVKSICQQRGIPLFKIDASDAYKYVAKRVSE
ncbi:DUF2971 domain-containing protein [Bacterioplanes sanyensis]|uniref:DUF2971 domain-containing protein n=1 Tax=Bacterioplanes sanyensis TaxID=1249553 RepID=UPI0012FD5451|nr:DUF2971 domain-containing protein [Bacterioplanes sanyensis]